MHWWRSRSGRRVLHSGCPLLFRSGSVRCREQISLGIKVYVTTKTSSFSSAPGLACILSALVACVITDIPWRCKEKTFLFSVAPVWTRLLTRQSSCLFKVKKKKKSHLLVNTLLSQIMKEKNSISYRQLRGFFSPVQKQHTASFSWKLMLDTCNTYTLVLVCILEQQLSEFGGLRWQHVLAADVSAFGSSYVWTLSLFFFLPSSLLCLSDAAFAGFLCAV